MPLMFTTNAAILNSKQKGRYFNIVWSRLYSVHASDSVLKIMAQVEMDHKFFIPKCIKHDEDLLPLFCRDCTRLLCSDCITTDHMGHNLCKVSEVEELHQKKLEKILKSNDSMSVLETILQRLQQERIDLDDHFENLIRRISEREEEIIHKVKLWSKKMLL